VRKAELHVLHQIAFRMGKYGHSAVKNGIARNRGDGNARRGVAIRNGMASPPGDSVNLQLK
jgi:hypothetical protein